MNTIEIQAFEVITPLIKGESRFITQEDQKKVSALCATMFTMIDREHIPTSGICSDEVQHIYLHKEPPTTWSVFLGRVKADGWDFRFRHLGALSVPKDGPANTSDSYNSQICTVGLRNLLLHVVSHNDRNVITDAIGYGKSLGIRPIHPFSEEFDFMSLKRLRAHGADAVANGLADEAFERGKRLMK
ncbi:MAG: hypothetical protein ABIO86_19360 [Sphingomonas sp.]